MLNVKLELIGEHPKFRKALDHARSLAVTKSPLLIIGDVGTGKRTVGQYVHENSARAQNQVIVVECSEEDILVEKAILGYRDEEGKFHRGALEQCHKGTVIFSDIDQMSDEFQKKFFNIIKELSDYELDVRLIATTTKNLSKLVAAGRFNRALYTYFSVSQITIPTLKERTGDVELIAAHFANVYAREFEVATPKISEDVIEKLVNQSWPSNVTELKSLIERCFDKLDNGEITMLSLESQERKVENVFMDESEEGVQLMSLREAEKLLIRKALIHTSENRTQAAKILGVSIRTLRNKINEYRVEGTSYFMNLR